MSKGYLCISLDFELMWGVIDHTTIEAYGQNIAGVRTAIPQLLDLFSEYDIHATWAVVGLLLSECIEDIRSYAPDQKPHYKNVKLSAYQYLDEVGEDEICDIYHYGNSLAKLICSYQGQEIGTHTFSHFYCLEGGQSKEAFEADLDASKKITKDKLGRDFNSIIFPRNQYNPEYRQLLIDAGITSYRGREKNWIYSEPNRFYKRIIRLADTYMNLTGPKCTALEDAVKDGIVNLRASRFFRPYMSRLAFLEGLKIRRIKGQMKYAAQNGRVFHLWWHPHNFGVMTDIHILQLREIFEYFQELSGRYGFESRNMGELAALALENSKRK